MGDVLDRWMDPKRIEARHELRTELATFSPGGLHRLARDLSAGVVARGSWAGCVLSYRWGTPGSARRDRRGRCRNAVTALWDNGQLTDEEVAAAVARELRRRATVLGAAA